MGAKRAMPHFRIPVDSDEFRLVSGIKILSENSDSLTHLYDFSDITSFRSELIHSTFLEELLFWTIVYEFPQKLVCFLLNMLPDQKYKVYNDKCSVKISNIL